MRLSTQLMYLLLIIKVFICRHFIIIHSVKIFTKSFLCCPLF